MSANSKRIERSLRFRRLRRGKDRAVSPVVATLILILIAVAAAAALYLWLVAWQGGVTSGIGSPGAQYTVTIGGSSSVYPWSVAAVKSFEGNNSNVIVNINQGGSGAGMAAVCSHNVDIGASSAPQTASNLVTSYGCPNTVVQETVAYDAVDAIVPQANPHGLVSLSWDTMQDVYVAAIGGVPVPVQAQTNLLTSSSYSMNGYPVYGLNVPAGTSSTGGTGFTWDQIPACVAGTKNCGGGSNPLEVPLNTTVASTGWVVSGAPVSITNLGVYTISATLTIAAAPADYFVSSVSTTGMTLSFAGGGAGTISAGYATITSQSYSTTTLATTVNIQFTFTASVTGTITGMTAAPNIGFPEAANFAAGSAALCGSQFCVGAGAATPCGWSVCAGGTATGTSAGDTGASIHPVQRSDSGGTTQSFTARLLGVGTAANAATSAVGFSGCAPTGQLTDCGISEKFTGFGNPGVIATTAGDKDAIGYASDGLVVTAGSGVVALAFQGIGQTNAVFPTVASTIVAGIVAGNGGTYGTGTYIGWRPFIYVQTAPPTGEVLRYLQWCMQPGNNQDFALAANELSPFQPGLAGHVPITPVP